MKRLLSLLSSFGLLFSSVQPILSCNGNNSSKNEHPLSPTQLAKKVNVLTIAVVNSSKNDVMTNKIFNNGDFTSWNILNSGVYMQINKQIEKISHNNFLATHINQFKGDGKFDVTFSTPDEAATKTIEIKLIFINDKVLLKNPIALDSTSNWDKIINDLKLNNDSLSANEIFFSNYLDIKDLKISDNLEEQSELDIENNNTILHNITIEEVGQSFSVSTPYTRDVSIFKNQQPWDLTLNDLEDFKQAASTLIANKTHASYTFYEKSIFNTNDSKESNIVFDSGNNCVTLRNNAKYVLFSINGKPIDEDLIIKFTINK